jgi:putative membrane protein
MKGFVLSVLATAVAIWVTIQLLPDYLGYSGDALGLIGIALTFGIVNGLIKPVVSLLALPIRMMTLGLFGFVINAAAFLLVAFVVNQLGIDFTVGGWPDGPFGLDTIVGAVIGAIVMSIVSTVIGIVVPD